MKWMRLKLPRAVRDLVVVLLLAIAFSFGLCVAAPAAKDPDASADDGQVWTCAMHPQIKLPEPGPCPICGMALIPLEKDDGAATVEVTLSERAKALARIRTAPVMRAHSDVEMRLLGRIEYDETRVRTITPWTGGRIDKLFVSSLGAKIKRGQAVASIYSPEVYAAQLDLLTARRQRKRLKDALPIAQRVAAQAEEAAEARLTLLGLSARAVKKRPSRNVAVTASFGGTVIEQLIHEGAYVKAGQPLFRIADLDSLWAQLDAYEGDLPRIVVGQSVTLVVSSYPGESFEGKVAFIDPIVDPHTRTAQIRVEVDNHDGRLSRGMFADAVIHADDAADREAPLIIPRNAPLFTGKRSLVYVEVPGRDSPTYVAREVRLGPMSGSHYPVLSGLREGELVVDSGAFTLDSDLQIRGGRSMMSMPDDSERIQREPVEVNEAFMQGLRPVVVAYLQLQTRLSSDDLAGTKQAYGQLAEAAKAFSPANPAAARAAWVSMSARLRPQAEQGARAEDIEAARRRFEFVSLVMLEALQRLGNPLTERLHAALCPMAIDKRAARWVQRADKVENPYWGARMYRCGSIEQPIGAGGRLLAEGAPATTDDGAHTGPQQHDPQAGHGGAAGAGHE